MNLVIYHSADFDGKISGAIAYRFLGVGAVYLGWNYSDPVPKVGPDDHVWLLDLSIPALMTHPKLTWIDHHASAIETYPESIEGYRIDGVAACRLVWQWFSAKFGSRQELPEKEAFVKREVDEPTSVRFAGEWDVWDHHDPLTVKYQYGLRSLRGVDATSRQFISLLDLDQRGYTQNCIDIVARGEAVLDYATTEYESLAAVAAFDLVWEGRTFLAINSVRGGSEMFKSKLTAKHDGCLRFGWLGNAGHWSISLLTDKPGVDLSPIAVKYGGGGHRGACEFVCKTLPFIREWSLLNK